MNEYARIRKMLLRKRRDEIVARGTAVVPHLIAALKDENATVRWNAVESLGRIRDVSAVPALVDALKDKYEVVRRRAARALGESGDASAVPALISALKYRNRRVRQEAVGALVKIGALAVPALVDALKDEDVNAREGAAEALRWSGEASAVPALIEALKDEFVQIEAACALGRIGVDKEQFEIILRMLSKGETSEEKTGAADALGMIARDNPENIEVVKAAPPLVDALKDEKEGVRWRAAWALGEIKVVSSVLALIAALKDGEEDVRSRAAEAIGKIANANPGNAEVVEAVPALIKCLKDAKEGVRRNAAEALVNIGIDKIERMDDRVLCLLILEKTDGLVGPGKAAVPALIAALKDENVQMKAAEALGEIGDPSAVPALIDVLNGGDKVMQMNAAVALGHIGDAYAVPALIGALKADERLVRWGAATALHEIAEKTGIDLRAVESALREFVDFVKKKGNPTEIMVAQKEAGGHYRNICEAAGKHAAEKHSLAGDGVILVGELPRPPSDGKKGMYRAGRETRALA